MPFDPISYSEVQKLKKELSVELSTDTIYVDKIQPKDGTTVTIQGDLNVVGNVTYIETTNLQVKDNVIELNSGETGSGVTLGSAGITIDRGTEPDAQVIWDENNDKFVFKLEDGTKLPVEVSNLNADTVSSSSITCDDIEPSADNTGTIGKSDKRYASIYVVNLYTGDIKLMNNWTVTERDENGEIIQNGVRILNDKGEEVFKITEDGIFFKGKRLKLVFEE